ncbi:MAG: peptide deformylase [Anaerolineae bacterium]|nr:peptide deformylase [Anaerolineae bacterium]NIN95542.1 peptide deformylase [Anaerolineae bacterium]NIQ78534.1 peptide deformylase [Anaerolineae bacterium]
MAIRPLTESGDPVLRQKAKKVRDFGPSLQALIDDLVDTMREAPGLGLAAPQIGVSLQVAVIELPEADEEEDNQDPYRGKLIVICNPEIVKTWGEAEAQEGCLSLPEYVGDVPRAARVLVKAQNRRGKPIRLRAEGLMARVLQHEVDHLNGNLFVDRVESLDKLYRVEPSDRGGEDQQEMLI